MTRRASWLTSSHRACGVVRIGATLVWIASWTGIRRCAIGLPNGGKLRVLDACSWWDVIGRAQLAGLALDIARPLNDSHDTLHGTRPQHLRLSILLFARSRWLIPPFLLASATPLINSCLACILVSTEPITCPPHPRGAWPSSYHIAVYNYAILSSSVASPRRPCISTAYDSASTTLIPDSSTRHCCRRQVLQRLATDTKQYLLQDSTAPTCRPLSQ